MPDQVNLEVVCTLCKAVTEKVGPVDVGPGVTEGMKWDTAQHLLQKMGWTVRTDARGRRYGVCPACLRKEDALQTLPPVTAHDLAACRKCGHDGLDLKYNDGTVPGSVYVDVPAEFLMLTCRRCGYRRPVGCLDAAAGEPHVQTKT